MGRRGNGATEISREDVRVVKWTGDKQINKLLKAISKMGCEIKRSHRTGHVKVTTPNGGMVMCSNSPKNSEAAVSSIKRALRRNGIEI